MQAAVSGSPGTLPANWAAVPRGTTRSMPTIGATGGIDYIDVKFTGTVSGNVALTVTFESTTGAAALGNQLRTSSCYLALVGGSLSNIASISLGCSQYDSGSVSQGGVAGVDIKGLLTANLQRFDLVWTTAAATAFVQPYIGIFASSLGVALDLTLRIGSPQNEEGGWATSMIRTINAAVSRGSVLT